MSTPVQLGAHSLSVIGVPSFSWDGTKAWGGVQAYRMPAKKNPTEVSSFKSTVFMAGIVNLQTLSVS